MPEASDSPWPSVLCDAYSRDAGRIRQYLARLVGQTDADDLTHDVFERAHRGLPQGLTGSRLSAWLFRIAMHAAIDRLRSQSVREREGSTLAIRDTTPGDETPPDRALDRARMRACIVGLVERLPTSQRAVIILSEIQQLSDREVAETLDISVGAAKIRLHRARRALRDLMKCECRTFLDERNELACEPVRATALRVVA